MIPSSVGGVSVEHRATDTMIKYVPLGIAILCNKTVYYMGVRVMRWDNVTVLNSGHSWVQFKALGPCGPLGFKLNPLVPRVKYGKIIPPHYSHPHIVYSFIT